MRADHKFFYAGFFFFLFTGIIYTQVTSRMPALKEQTGIHDGDVGLALMCMGLGSLAGFLTINLVLRYLQVRQALRLSSLTFLGICLLMGLVHSREMLFLLFAFWGFSCAYLDVSMNTHALYVEMKTGNPHMAMMHAGYSVGCLAGSALGSAFAFMGVALFINFSTVAVLLGALFLYFHGALLPDPPKTTEKEKTAADNTVRPQRRFIPLFVIFCGLMGMFSYTAEGSVAEWGSLVLHQVKQAIEGVAALAYGVFALFMAFTRFGIDHLRSRLGDRLILLCGSSLAFAGMLIVFLSPQAVVCLGGYALMGIGLAPVFPIALSNAGRRTDISPKAATAAVSFVGYTGLLVIPPFLGFLADHFGLGKALLLPLAAIALVIAGSFAFKGRRSIRCQHA